MERLPGEVDWVETSRGRDDSAVRVVGAYVGWEHVTSRVFVQWLAPPTEPDGTRLVLATTAVDSTMLSLGKPRIALHGSGWVLGFTATSPYMPEPVTTVTVTVPGRPGALVVEETQAQTQVAPCEHLPFFARWFELGVASRAGDTLELALRFDLHAQDCGAPDSYGTDVKLRIALAGRNGGCVAKSVTLEQKRWGDWGPDESALLPQSFSLDAPISDLANASLNEFTLTSIRHETALVLERRSAYFYEDVKPGMHLERRLVGDDDDPALAWPATLTVTRRLHDSP